MMLNSCKSVDKGVYKGIYFCIILNSNFYKLWYACLI